MGVTIHFEGSLDGDDAFAQVTGIATSFAKSREWRVGLIHEAEVQIQRIRDEESWEYVGPVKGLVIQPHENSDPPRLEFDLDLYVQEFIKTQFAPHDTHRAMIDF